MIHGMAFMVLAAEDPGRIVGLVTGDQGVAEASSVWWRVVLVFVGFAAIATAVLVAAWRLRTSDFDAAERAFVALSRRRGLRAGARALLRRAAAVRGCEPVALLVSRHALAGALAALRDAGSAADALSVEAVLGSAGRAPAGRRNEG